MRRAKYLLLYAATFLDTSPTVVDCHCIDIHSRVVSQGLHYVPRETNPCTLCICDNGSPKWCKSVLCSPPQNCKSFQVGNSCCEFKCLDDILSGHDNYKETYDVALRFIASTVTAVLSISLLFFLYNRLKRNKLIAHHNHQRDESRNLSNVGYIAGNFGYNQHNIGYLGSGTNEIEIRYEEPNSNFSLWKPPGNYFPSGEAPPPYEEAMRSSQNDAAQNATAANNTNLVASAYQHQPEINPALICRHEEPVPTTASQISATHYFRAHVEHPKDKPEVSYENISVLKNSSAERATSSGCGKPSSQFRKVSRPDPQRGATLKDHSAVFLHQEPLDGPYQRYLDRVKLESHNARFEQKRTLHRTLPINLRELLSNSDGLKENVPISLSNSSSKIEVLTHLPPPELSSVHQTVNAKKQPIKNLITYQSLSQDEEDYSFRSECENCKSIATIHSNDDDGETMNETMSLQRRPLSEPGYEKCFRTSHTLPTNPRKTRIYPCASSSRDEWFSPMQQSSSEDSD